METSSFYDEKADIYIVTVTGTIKRPNDSMALQKMGVDIAQKEGYNSFLFDMSEGDVIPGETVDNFNVGIVPSDKDRKSRHVKIALLYSGDLSDHVFMESVARNRGYNLRIFNDKKMALDWLTKAKI